MKLALLKQQQDVEGVVDRLPGPVVTVVPGADRVAIQAHQFGRKHLVEVTLGIAAEGRVAAIEGDIVEIVEP